MCSKVKKRVWGFCNSKDTAREREREREVAPSTADRYQWGVLRRRRKPNKNFVTRSMNFFVNNARFISLYLYIFTLFLDIEFDLW